MKVGVTTFLTDESLPAEQLGRAVEERGFHSLSLPEHSHMPVTLDSRRPGASASEERPPREYYRTLDAFVALGAISAATSSLVLQTAITLIVQRDPILLAKECATVDFISGGRFRLGIGAGWNKQELRNHGIDPARRTAVMREKILAVKEIWTNDSAEFHGEFVNFDPVHQWPKPAQQPHPPILVGGLGPTVLERVREYGDAWMPSFAGVRTVGPRVAELRSAGGDRRKGVILSAVPIGRAELEAAAELDVDECTVKLPTLPPDKALQALDAIAAIRDDVGLGG